MNLYNLLKGSVNPLKHTSGPRREDAALTLHKKEKKEALIIMLVCVSLRMVGGQTFVIHSPRRDNYRLRSTLCMETWKFYYYFRFIP